MSELVQRHLEAMIPETEEMKRTKLYSDDEIKVILRKREHFEYKIIGATKALDDFLAYIKFEKVIIRDVKNRRHKYRISEKKSEIEYKILKRIKYLYEVATQRFNNFELMLDFFKFCKECNYTQSVYSIVENMLKQFSQNVEAWQVASAWHAKKDVTEALKILHKGLAFHKDSEVLYCEAIELELSKFKKDDASSEPTSEEESLVCQKINTYLQTAYSNIKSYQFPLCVLDILEKYPFTKGVQDSIVTRLLDVFYGEDEVWHALSQREYRGFFYAESDSNLAKSTKFRIRRCCEQYETGLEKISAGKAPLLWSKYLDWLIEVYQQKNDTIETLTTLLLDALKKGSEICHPFPERYYVIWAKLMNDEKDMLEILNKGLAALPDSIDLWKLKLKMAVLKDDTIQFNNIFNDAIKSLKERALPLWIMALRFHSLQSSNRVLESIYEQGVHQPKEVSSVLKCEYLQWMAISKSITQTRLKYTELAAMQPYSKELHLTMAQLEQSEMTVRLENLENIYKLLCDQFGREDPDVWITRMKFYLENHHELESRGDFSLNDVFMKIYKDAERLLGTNSFSFSDFKEKFTKVGQGYCIS